MNICYITDLYINGSLALPNLIAKFLGNNLRNQIEIIMPSVISFWSSYVGPLDIFHWDSSIFMCKIETLN